MKLPFILRFRFTMINNLSTIFFERIRMYPSGIFLVSFPSCINHDFNFGTHIFTESLITTEIFLQILFTREGKAVKHIPQTIFLFHLWSHINLHYEVDSHVLQVQMDLISQFTNIVEFALTSWFTNMIRHLYRLPMFINIFVVYYMTPKYKYVSTFWFTICFRWVLIYYF